MTDESRGQPQTRLEYLDAMRGLAALSIVPYHVIATVHGPLPWYGFYVLAEGAVSVFFVLTGFIVTSVHGNDIAAHWTGAPPARTRFLLRQFLMKRFVHLFPFLWLLTAGVLLASFVLPGAMRTEKHEWSHILASFAVWPVHDVLPILPQAWILPHDIRFYLLFALAYLISARMILAIMTFLVVGVVLNLLRHLQLVPLGEWNYLVDFLFHPFNLTLGYGALITLLFRTRGVPSRSALMLATGLLVFGAVYLADLGRLSTNYDLRMLLYGLASAAVVHGVAAYDLVVRPHIHRSLRVLGKASYSIYLTHLPVTVLLTRFLRPIAGDRLGNAEWVWAQVAVCVLAGVLMHTVLEQPITSWTARYLRGSDPLYQPIRPETR